MQKFQISSTPLHSATVGKIEHRLMLCSTLFVCSVFGSQEAVLKKRNKNKNQVSTYYGPQ